MRFYGFGNYYLSSLQQGLQAGHVVGEFLGMLELDSIQFRIAREWARDHKTMVLLNGGNSASIQAIFEKLQEFEKQGMTLPFMKFHEDQQSLGGALTYAGIVVPEHIYSQTMESCNLHGWELELFMLIKPLRNAI